MRVERWPLLIVLRLRSLFRRGDVERELDEELRYHIDRQTAEHVALGMSPDAARAAALRAMGGVELRKEQVRDIRGTRWIEDFGRDVRYALRTLGRSPGFTTVVVLTLALGAFSLVALVISAVGIYCLVSYSVSRRRQEIGIRIALGARRTDVFRLVASHVAVVVASGIAVGLAGASLGSRALERFLYGITPLDLAAFLAATVVMSLAAAIACVLPARRAMRIDPIIAIRSE